MDTTGSAVSVVVTRCSDGALVASRVAVAGGFWSRLRGLLGRHSLEPGAGLLIEPCSSVHTIGMRFAIDAVFLHRDRTVAAVAGELRPWRMAAHPGAAKVLELPAGCALALALTVGDELRFEPAASGRR